MGSAAGTHRHCASDLLASIDTLGDFEAESAAVDGVFIDVVEVDLFEHHAYELRGADSTGTQSATAASRVAKIAG